MDSFLSLFGCPAADGFCGKLLRPLLSSAPDRCILFDSKSFFFWSIQWPAPSGMDGIVHTRQQWKRCSQRDVARDSLVESMTKPIAFSRFVSCVFVWKLDINELCQKRSFTFKIELCWPMSCSFFSPSLSATGDEHTADVETILVSCLTLLFEAF